MSRLHTPGLVASLLAIVAASGVALTICGAACGPLSPGAVAGLEVADVVACDVGAMLLGPALVAVCPGEEAAVDAALVADEAQDAGAPADAGTGLRVVRAPAGLRVYHGAQLVAVELHPRVATDAGATDAAVRHHMAVDSPDGKAP